MKKFFTGLFLGLLAIMFITCVYAGNVNERFSLEKWLTNIASYSPEGTLGEDLTAAWTENGYFYYEKSEDGTFYRVYKGYGSAYEGSEEVLVALSQIPLFFERLWASVRILVDHVRMILEWSKLLLPWNATVAVPRGASYV